MVCPFDSKVVMGANYCTVLFYLGCWKRNANYVSSVPL